MVILKSLDEQIQIDIDEGQNLLLGRLPKCDIFIDDGSISSQHARLKLKNNQLRVVDMGSTNGIRLNYSLLSAPEYLQDGDTIEFGNVTFIVDGPLLEIPSQVDPSPQALTSLERIDASQKLDDTMLTPSISEADLVDEEPEPLFEVEEDVDHNQPVHFAFFIALGLILLGGILLIAHIWNLEVRY